MKPIRLAAVVAVAVAVSGPALAAPLSPFAQNVLAIHNRERARLGSPPLRWDPRLEADAAAYARQLASSGGLAHSSRSGRSGERENLSMGMRGSTPQQMIQNWIAEKSDFIPGLFPDISRDGQWTGVSHFSQMIWAATTSIGCAQASGAQWDYLVCRYAPAGNIDGQPVLRKPCDPVRTATALAALTPSLCRSPGRAASRGRS